MSTNTQTNYSYSRTKPLLARIKERYLLSKKGATKEVYHLTLCIKNSGITYQVGDAIGILPQNPPHIVNDYLNALGLTGDEPLTCPRTDQDLSARSFLLKSTNLERITTKLKKALQPPADLEITTPLELFNHLNELPSLPTLAPLFAPLLPRFYSIASSQRIHPEEIHLTIAVPSYLKKGKKHYGLASSFLCHRATQDTPIPLYLQPASHFHLPQNPSTPLIMIGPGTGIAPFRAFLQERLALKAPGKHWLFFGERNRATDFYYEEEWKKLIDKDKLQLELAFSRDQEEKIYVQDRLLEHAETIWQWLEQGAAIYLCGDAKNMARAVTATLKQIAETVGKQPNATAFLKQLRATKRFCTDIY